MAAAPAVTRATGPGPAAPETGDGTAAPPLGRSPLVVVAVGVACAAGIALRAYTRSELWLDEALTVHLSEVPLGELSEVLRRDGAPSSTP